MFPASAGMNRIDGPVCLYRLDVPRERGDEPDSWGCTANLQLCSPRARG